MQNEQLTGIIKKATKQIVERTLETVELAKECGPGEECVIMMVNGKEVTVEKSQYQQMKEENKRVRSKMKSDIKDAVSGWSHT